MMRHHPQALRQRWLVAFALSGLVACSSSAPTSPTSPSTPRLSIRFGVANPASLSVSEPIRCPGDWSTCPGGSLPQGPATAGAIVTKDYELAPGTYRLTGVLVPAATEGVWLAVRIATQPSPGVNSGAAREGPVLGMVAFSGDQTLPLNAVVSESCGGRFFSNPSGALEWSVAFRVIAGSEPDGLCLGSP